MNCAPAGATGNQPGASIVAQRNARPLEREWIGLARPGGGAGKVTTTSFIEFNRVYVNLDRRNFLAPLRGAEPIFPFNQGLPGYASLRRAPLANLRQPLPGQRNRCLMSDVSSQVHQMRRTDVRVKLSEFLGSIRTFEVWCQKTGVSRGNAEAL